MRSTVAILLVILNVPLAGAAADIKLDGDSDRNGTVDGTPVERLAKATKSVIVLNNCDDSDGDGKPDHLDAVINGGHDQLQLEPIILRKLAGPVIGTLSLVIKKASPDDVPEGRRVRVFSTSGTALLGPGTLSHELTAADVALLAAGDMTLLVEGLAFGTSVRISVNLNGVEQDFLTLEVAPFLLTPNSLKPMKNYVVKVPSGGLAVASHKYVKAFQDACDTAGVASEVISSIDVWIEDELSWGYTETPRVRMPVALHMLRLRPLRTEVRKLVKPDVGYATPFDFPADTAPSPDSINYGGNLEVAPPTPQFPFGRVYYGSVKSADDASNVYDSREIDPRFQKFFKRQKLQLPIDLNTDWLAVGHVDELVSFVPKANAPGNLLLIASPKLAFDVIRSLPPDTPLDPKYGLMFPGLETVADFTAFGQFSGVLQRSFEQYNMDVDFKTFGLDHAHPDPTSVKGRLKAALNIAEADIIEVPALYFNMAPDRWAAAALTPGTVNLSAMGKHTLAPNPFIAEFRTPFEAALTGVGNKTIWIDDWAVYHQNVGEVHCGSNMLREPFSKKWWE